MALFWVPMRNGNFAMSGATDVLQMKEDDVLKFFAAGTYLVGTNLDF